MYTVKVSVSAYVVERVHGKKKLHEIQPCLRWMDTPESLLHYTFFGVWAVSVMVIKQWLFVMHHENMPI